MRGRRRRSRLINDAWNRFAGQEPVYPGSSAARARLLRAQGELGTKEHPAWSNRCKYTEWYGMTGPWCAMFCTWVDQTCTRRAGSFARGDLVRLRPSRIVSDARRGINGLSVTSDPRPGDLVCYDWDRIDRRPTTTSGSSKSGSRSSWTAIESNTC